MKKLLTILVLIMLIISFFQITNMYALYKEQIEKEYNTALGAWKIKVNETDVVSGGYDSTTTTWRDLSGNHDGEIHGATWENDYLKLDGVDDWVNLGYVELTNQVTVDATVKVYDISINEVNILGNWYGGGTGIWIAHGKPSMDICVEKGKYLEATSSDILEVGKIYHIIGTYDGTSVKLYVNGELKAERAETRAIIPPENNNVMAIGCELNADFANINVYSAKVYNRALTETEITNGASTTEGLIRSYDAKNNTIPNRYDSTATTWRDLSGNHDGEIHGATWENDYLKLDGVDDWVNLGQVELTNQVTVDATITVNEIQTGVAYILNNFELGGIGLFLTSGVPAFQVYIDGVGYVQIKSSKSATMGEKIRITGTYNGENLSLYINGKLEAKKTQTGTIRVPKSNTVMAIGCNPSGSAGDGFSNINVYSAKVYNRALTETEIKDGVSTEEGLIRSYDAKNNTASNGQTSKFTITGDNLVAVPSEHVQAGKIAPGGEAYFDIVIDPTDTDVSIIYKMDVDMANITTTNPDVDLANAIELTRCENYFGQGADGQTNKVTNASVQVDGNTYTGIIPLDKINQGYKNYIRLYFKWNNVTEDGVETNNEKDTALGSIYNAKISIPLQINLKQYTGE